MLHEPGWIHDWFSPLHLTEVAKGEFARRFTPLFESKRSKRHTALHQQASETAKKLKSIMESLTQLQEQKQGAEKRLHERQEYIATLRNHQDQLLKVGI